MHLSKGEAKPSAMPSLQAMWCWPPRARFEFPASGKGCPLSSLSPHKKANDPCQPRSLDKEILGKSGLVELTNGGPLRITEDGRKVLADHPEFIDIKYLNRFSSFQQSMEPSVVPQPFATFSPSWTSSRLLWVCSSSHFEDRNFRPRTK
jgi:hypothetical protein